MSEETPPPEGKPHGFDLGKIPDAFDLQTDNLGILKGGLFTVGVMIALEPLLKATPQVPDEELARATMRNIVRHQPVGEEREGKELSEDEALKITDADVERFAVILLRRERCAIGTDATGSPITPASALARFVRDSHDKITQSTQRWAKAFGPSVLSNRTMEALNTQAVWAEKLNPLSKLGASVKGWADIADRFKVFNQFTKIQPDFHLPEIPAPPKLGPSLADTIRNTPKPAQVMRDNTVLVVEAISTAAAEAEKSRKINSDATIGILADVLNETKKQIELSEENTDRLIKKADADAKDNAKSQRSTTKLAILAIVLSIIFGGVGTWVAWKSYTHDLAVEVSEQQEKAAVQRLAEEQKALLRESVAEQKEQNRILRDALAKTNKATK